MKVYKVSGTFLMGTERSKFTKEVAGEKQSDVIEHVYSDLGSKHRTKRRDIKIQRIEEIPPEDASDPKVKYALSHAAK